MAEKKSTKDMTAEEFEAFVEVWTDGAEAAMGEHTAEIERATAPQPSVRDL